MPLQRTIRSSIHAADPTGYIADCPDLGIVTHGHTIDEAARHLRSAVERALAGRDLAQFGLAEAPAIVVTFELHPQLDAQNGGLAPSVVSGLST